MTRVQQAFPEISEILKASSGKIIAKWEAEVRVSVKSSAGLSKLALRDSLPEFLTKLADALTPQSTAVTLAEAARIGRKHGSERASQSNYHVTEVLAEYWIFRGAIFHFLELEAPMPLPARDIVLAAVDESIREAVNEFAEERTRKLEQSNRDLEHFAAVAAHDLKAPLATISGYLEIIEEQVEEKAELDIGRHVKTIRRAAGRMSVMIDRLLEYSSVGKKIAPFVEINISELVADVVESLRSSIDHAHAKITVGDLPNLRGDPSLISMVFQNLLSNAIKFRDGRVPVIKILGSEEGSEFCFKVVDNGIGFDPKQVKNIFSLFKQFHESPQYQGFGIGLATVKKVMELHGGDAYADSEIGVGSTFSFSFPK